MTGFSLQLPAAVLRRSILMKDEGFVPGMPGLNGIGFQKHHAMYAHDGRWFSRGTEKSGARKAEVSWKAGMQDSASVCRTVPYA